MGREPVPPPAAAPDLQMAAMGVLPYPMSHPLRDGREEQLVAPRTLRSSFRYRSCRLAARMLTGSTPWRTLKCMSGTRRVPRRKGPKSRMVVCGVTGCSEVQSAIIEQTPICPKHGKPMVAIADTKAPGRSMAQVETVLTRYFVWTVLALVLVPIGAFTLIVTLTSVSLDDANKYVDTVVKMLAGLVGAAWALNRFFANRADALHVRLDPHVSLVPQGDSSSPDSDALLLYRVEIINTGRVLFKDYWVEVEIASVEVDTESRKPVYFVADEVPRHAGGPIEPGSWAAVSGAVVVAGNLRAVRLAAQIENRAGSSWTWHQLFSVGADLPHQGP